MYSAGEFSTGCDIWLAGICRYLNEAYTSITTQILRLLTTVGCVSILQTSNRCMFPCLDAGTGPHSLPPPSPAAAL